MALFLPTDTFAYIDLNDEIIHVEGLNIVDRGTWSIINSYVPNDVISYQNALYICLAGNTGLPPTAIRDDYWSSLVKVEGVSPGLSLEQVYEIAVSGSNLAAAAYGSLSGTGFIPNQPLAVHAFHVDFGTTSGTQVSAISVPYANGTYPTVAAALDALLYVPLQITSFNNSVGTVEIGSTVTSVVLTWAYNKAITSQSINQGIGSLATNLTAYTDNGSFTSNRTYTLSASDGQTPANRSTTLSFSPKRYWGPSSDAAITDPEIIALSQEFASGFAQTKNITAAAQYVYFAFPSSFGTPTFTVNGLLNTAWTLTTRTFVNASGHSSSYDIWRSNNLLTGSYVIQLS